MTGPPLPEERGPLSGGLLAYLRGEAAGPGSPAADADPLTSEDFQLALYTAYELHYRGFAGVSADREWDPAILAWRGALEDAFLARLEEVVPRGREPEPERLGATLFEMAAEDDSPSVARHLGARGTAAQFRELMIHRSAYQLKEADPHSWAIPRLEGRAKAAMLEVQYDEYGSGEHERIHARLFADAMDAVGLDSAYGAYLDAIPARTLATVNLMTFFGLNRRWLGAIVGHLAMFEITSSEGARRTANGLRRVGLGDATGFFDEHVEADSIHENIAAYDLAQGLAVDRPELTGDILFGATALMEIEARWMSAVLDDWDQGRSSLRRVPAGIPA